MSADSWEKTHSAPIGSLAEPLYFGPSNGRLFGWLHAPRKDSVSDAGLVICQPFGYEAICAHRCARTLAETAAALGVPALQFDYLGSGDSAEIDPEADQIEVWSTNTLAAIEELQRRSGATRIFLLGFRMGALLAAQVASRCAAVQGLVLIAPVVSGRRYLRELRTTRLASLLAIGGAAASGPSQDDAGPGAAQSLEVSGFSLSAATLASLAKVDLMNVEVPLACDTLVVDGSSLPAARSWAEQRTQRGGRIRYSALPAVFEMMITAPQFLVTSQPMIDTAREWLAERVATSAVRASDGAGTVVSTAGSASRSLTLHPPSAPANETLCERPTFFGSEVLLFGIITEPAPGEVRRRGVILLNAGADHHVGPSRIYVSVARRWARSGYYVLRMDLAGIGNSATRTGSPDDEVFPPAAMDDIRAGIELLKTRYGIRDITLAGLCSGAYHALRGAVAGLPISRILMVNPLNFFWKKGMQLENLQVAEVIVNPGRYRQRVMDGAAWKRLLGGRVNVWRIVKIYFHRTMLPLQSMLRDAARRLRVPLNDDLGREMEDIVARGVQIVFVFAHGEPGIELLKLQGGSSVKRIGERCRIRMIERADHAFSQSGPRAALEEILSEELYAPPRLNAIQTA